MKKVKQEEDEKELTSNENLVKNKEKNVAQQGTRPGIRQGNLSLFGRRAIRKLEGRGKETRNSVTPDAQHHRYNVPHYIYKANNCVTQQEGPLGHLSFTFFFSCPHLVSSFRKILFLPLQFWFGQVVNNESRWSFIVAMKFGLMWRVSEGIL